MCSQGGAREQIWPCIGPLLALPQNLSRAVFPKPEISISHSVTVGGEGGLSGYSLVDH